MIILLVCERGFGESMKPDNLLVFISPFSCEFDVAVLFQKENVNFDLISKDLRQKPKAVFLLPSRSDKTKKVIQIVHYIYYYYLVPTQSMFVTHAI